MRHRPLITIFGSEAVETVYVDILSDFGAIQLITYGLSNLFVRSSIAVRPAALIDSEKGQKIWGRRWGTAERSRARQGLAYNMQVQDHESEFNTYAIIFVLLVLSYVFWAYKLNQ